MQKEISIKDLLENPKEIKDFIFKGWVVSLRGNNKIKFLIVNDGSTISNLQIVLNSEKINFETNNLNQLRNGSSILVKGDIILTPNKPQPFELNASEFTILSLSDETYPIQNQEINLETLREIPHVRHRTNYLKAIMLIRSALAFEIHSFFNKEGFLYMNSPIITSNDGEGAGEVFLVDDENKEPFFNKKATLAVTGQLHAESYALGFKKVYTFGPTFRAEKSNTKKHAAEFWMIEPEVSFYKLPQIISLADKMLKEVISNVMKKYKEEFMFLDEKSNFTLIKRLESFLNNDLKIIEYKDAIEILKKSNYDFENKDIFFGLDLATEHEKYLCDVHFKAPIAVINYPKEVKAFYMYLNDDLKTVAAFDLLVPGIGELIGGSQRECRINILKERMSFYNISENDMQWYIDLRKFGNSGSSGFGLGFERLVMYVCGIENIRDTIPFPRTSSNLKM